MAWTVVATLPGTMVACADDEEVLSTDPADQERVFPQGLASGDPRADSVIVWTRVAGPGAVALRYEVALDPAFASIVAQGDASVDAATDHCFRLKLTGLKPYTAYHYRFVAEGVQSIVGRTKTAPAADQDVEVRFAFASCQDFNGRYYHAYRALHEEAEVDFVLFLGDYVYETEGDPRFQDPSDERFIQIQDGIEIGGSGDTSFKAAKSLEDYRSLYRQYRSDKDLQLAHANYPFVCIWDDHEFADDCWQDHATHFNEKEGSEQDAQRRQDASQAWFEYMPADVVYDAASSFPEDLKIYRQLRYGKHLDLVLSDQRYYRDDHLIPEGPVDPAVGKLGLNDSLGARQFLLKSGFDMLEASAKPTMLGDTQKAWLVETINTSSATWKVWGNETQLAQMLLDLSSFDKLPEQYRSEFYFTTDQWDGYRSERAEIMAAIATTSNVVALTGDIHAFYACEIQALPDSPADATMVEYTTAGISSTPVQEITKKVVSGSETLTSLGLADLVPQFDQILLDSSSEYTYANSNVNGIAIVELDSKELRVEFLTVAADDAAYAGVTARERFVTKSGSNAVTKT